MSLSVTSNPLEIQLVDNRAHYISAGVVLGSLVYHVDIPTPVKSIFIELVGLKTIYSGSAVKQEQKFFSKKLSLLETPDNANGNQYLKESFYNLPFEFTFPTIGDLPPSFSCQLGRKEFLTFTYWIQATVEKHFMYSPNLQTAKRILFKPNNNCLNYSISSLMDSQNKLLPNFSSKIFKLHLRNTPRGLHTKKSFLNLRDRTNKHNKRSTQEQPMLLQTKFHNPFSIDTKNVPSARFIPTECDISDFLSLSLVTPNDLTLDAYSKNNQVILEQLSVKLVIKTFSKDKLVGKKTMSLLDSTPGFDIKLSQLEKHTETNEVFDPKISQSFSGVSTLYKLSLPTDLYKCLIPNISTSFEFQDISREYTLGVSMDLATNNHKSATTVNSYSSVVLVNNEFNSIEEFLPVYTKAPTFTMLHPTLS